MTAERCDCHTQWFCAGSSTARLRTVWFVTRRCWPSIGTPHYISAILLWPVCWAYLFRLPCLWGRCWVFRFLVTWERFCSHTQLAFCWCLLFPQSNFWSETRKWWFSADTRRWTGTLTLWASAWGCRFAGQALCIFGREQHTHRLCFLRFHLVFIFNFQVIQFSLQNVQSYF